MRKTILILLTLLSSPAFAARGDIVSYMHLETVDARRLMYERKFFCPEGRGVGQAQAVKV